MKDNELVEFLIMELFRVRTEHLPHGIILDPAKSAKAAYENDAIFKAQVDRMASGIRCIFNT